MKLLMSIVVGATTVLNFANTAKIVSAEDLGSIRFLCFRRSNILYVTVAETPLGQIDMITWQRNTWGTQGILKRKCRSASDRLQRSADNNSLQYISTGKISGSNAICFANEEGKCKSNGLITNFSSERDPETLLTEMFNISAPESNPATDEASNTGTNGTSDPETDAKLVVDIKAILEENNLLPTSN